MVGDRPSGVLRVACQHRSVPPGTRPIGARRPSSRTHQVGCPTSFDVGPTAAFCGFQHALRVLPRLPFRSSQVWLASLWMTPSGTCFCSPADRLPGRLDVFSCLSRAPVHGPSTDDVVSGPGGSSWAVLMVLRAHFYAPDRVFSGASPHARACFTRSVGRLPIVVRRALRRGRRRPPLVAQSPSRTLLMSRFFLHDAALIAPVDRRQASASPRTSSASACGPIAVQDSPDVPVSPARQGLDRCFHAFARLTFLAPLDGC